MQDKIKEKKYFDIFVASDSWSAFTDKSYDKIIALFLRNIKPKNKDQIVDMGCGTGEMTKKIHSSGLNVMGFDISQGCITMAKKNYPEIKFKIQDIENTQLNDNSVDILFYCGILHHFSNYNLVLKEAYRILKKNGKIFIFEPNLSNPILWLFRDEKSPISSDKMRTPNEKFLKIKDLEINLKKEKFDILKLQCISAISYSKDYFKKLFPFPTYYLVYFYNIFDFLLNKSPFNKKYGSYIMACIKK